MPGDPWADRWFPMCGGWCGRLKVLEGKSVPNWKYMQAKHYVHRSSLGVVSASLDKSTPLDLLIAQTPTRR